MTKLLVIDISNFIFRAYHSITPLNAPDGTPVNAVYGVLGMVHNLITKYKPTHILIARESSNAESVRKAIFADYKASRSEAPDNLRPQFSLIYEMLRGLELPQVSVSGYEADDVIGSAVTQWKNDFDEIIIATGDKDMLQFVEGNVSVVDTLKNIHYDREKVKEKMGVYPEYIVDYLSLIGDKVDDIPGVEGIGPKSAVQLIERYGHLDSIISNVQSIESKRSRECMAKGIDAAKTSHDLASIRLNLDLGKKVDELSYVLHSTGELEAFFERLGFKSWKGRIK